VFARTGFKLAGKQLAGIRNLHYPTAIQHPLIGAFGHPVVVIASGGSAVVAALKYVISFNKAAQI